MAWQMTGTYYAPCSCNVACPCAFGEMDGDRGWCSGLLLFDVKGGDVDGVDVGGTCGAIVADWPRGFLAGEGKGRLYVDSGVSDEQRAALERVLTGQAGGSLEPIGALIPEWLPVQQVSIDIQNGGDETRATIGDVGEAVIKPLKNEETGGPTTVVNMPVRFVEHTILGRGDGTRFKDPDLREWESGGHGEQGDFEWSG